MSGAKPTTPEAITAEPDSKHDGDKRRTRRQGGASSPPPGADTAWWTQDGGTHTAAHPTSTAPSERPAPDIPAPTIAPEAADSTTAEEPASDVSPSRNVRPTRRRGPRPTKVPTDRPTRSRRPKLSDSSDSSDSVGPATAVEPAVEPLIEPAVEPAGESVVEPAVAGVPADIDSVEPADINTAEQAESAEPATSVDAPAASEAVEHLDLAASTEPAPMDESTEPAAVVDVADGGSTDDGALDELINRESAADDAFPDEPPADELLANEPLANEPLPDEPLANEPLPDEPTGVEPVGEPSAAALEPDSAESAESSPAVPELAPIQPSGGEPDDEPADIDTAMNPGEPATGQDAAFPMSATIVADGDFVDEPEFAVPDIGAPASTRRNAPDTGFPIRTVPARPPTRRGPTPALTTPPPAFRRARPTPVPIQAPARSDVLGDLWGGDSDRVPGALAPARRRQPVQTGRPHRHRKAPRRPAFGLPALLVFALAAAFFAWVSATPLLLTAGHGSRGVATVATCSVHGIDRSCAEFVAADKSFSAAVTLLGPASAHASAGQKLDAQMVSRGSNLAYAGNNTDLLLHWIPGVVLLILCGFGIAWATGALRLVGRRTRTLALLGSFGGPILLFAGMLAYAW
ncbi:MAG TPA: hypothetical protein VE132_02120 [Micromonosporaceae bacterium]|nr:hypothetical protein [Micromonosporaceae bacterium]